ncbi:MAG: glycosyltransferase family 4 protein [Acidimicrobiia bacterium]|nr:glycosyltransferase family 4 protein [Acidimicrobiia bacterium]
MSAYRVLQVHNRPRQPGGADRMVDQERDVLTEHGHVVEQWLLDSQSLSGLRAGVAAIWNPSARRSLRRTVAEFEPDLIHLHTPFPFLSASVFEAFADLPVVHTVHSYRWSCIAGTHYLDGATCDACVGRTIPVPAARNRCYQDSLVPSLALAAGLTVHRLKGSLDRIDRVVTFSPSTAEQLVRTAVAPEKIAIVPNFVEDPGPPTDHDDGYALFLGRLTAEKGIVTLVQAWTQHRQRDGLRLTIVGDGPLGSWVKSIASHHDEVDFLGWRDRDFVGDLLRRASCLVFPSEWYEGMPLSILEAFACGVPVLVSDVGNYWRMVEPGRTGHVFRSQDPADLARLVDDLANRPSVLSQMRPHCRAAYEAHHTPTVGYERLARLYDEVMAEHRSRS